MYPENIPVCCAIAMLCAVLEWFITRAEQTYKYQMSMQMKLMRGINKCMIGFGILLNMISLYLRYHLHRGPFTFLWCRGMDCFYLYLLSGLLYLLVYLIGYKEFHEIRKD